jgi:hypothetical protein
VFDQLGSQKQSDEEIGTPAATVKPAAEKPATAGRPAGQEPALGAASAAAGFGIRKIAAMGAAFACGALAMAGVFQLARSPAYLGPCQLVAGLVTGMIAALLGRDPGSARNVFRLLAIAAAGAGIALIGYIVGRATYSPGPESAVPYIQPADGSNLDVAANGTASFAVMVPSRYEQLTVTFTATTSGAAKSGGENCIDGSSLDIAPSYNNALGQVQNIANGMPDTIQIPRGISSFTLAVQFVPQIGYSHCDDQILIAAAQFSS